MYFLRKSLLASVALLGLSACGGGSGSQSEDSAKQTETASTALTLETLSGIFTGTFSTGGSQFFVDAIVASTGEIRVITELDEQLSGVLTISGNNFSIDPAKSFLSPGNLSDNYYAAVFNASGKASGDVTATEITGESEFDDQLSTFSLNKEAELSSLEASFSVIEGNYVTPDSLSSFAFDADGEINGLDDEGCLYSGNIEVDNPNKNVYRMSLVVENCGEFDDTYTGLGTYSPASTIEGVEVDTFLFQVDNNEVAITSALLRN